MDKNPVTDKATIIVNPNKSDQYELNLFDMRGAKVAVLFTGEIRQGNLKTISLDRITSKYLQHLTGAVYVCVLKRCKGY